MRFFLLIFICSLLVGCSPATAPMSRQEVIDATKQCEEAGLLPTTVTWAYQIVDVLCYPRKP